jgi:zinc protease
MKTLSIALLCSLALTLPYIMVGEETVATNKPVLLPVKNDPTISFRIWFKVGAQNDPAGKEGLASLTAAMLSDASTQKNSYAEIINKLYPLATGYDASTSMEMTVFYGRTHKDNIKQFYSLFMDALLVPAFKQEDLDRIKSQVLNYMENTLRYASDEELGKAVLYNELFNGTPYGHINAGTVEAVKSITLDDIRTFYKQYYTRDNLVIGLGGGYTPELLATLKKDLGKLPAGTPKPVAKSKAKALDGFDVTLIEKDAASTAISIGFPIKAVRGTKEWYALAIANSWLGEHRNSSSHLYQVIREARGLNYGDYSYIEHYPNGGQRQLPPQNVCRRQQIFEIWIRPVPNETRLFALRTALREFKRLAENGMTKNDFELTRGFLNKYVLHYAPTTMERLAYALDDRFYGIEGSHLEKFRKMMKSLTLADVNASIKKQWQFGNMQIAIVTKNAAGFKEDLLKNNPSPITYNTPKPESILTEDKEISTFPIKVKEGHIKIFPVADLFAK